MAGNGSNGRWEVNHPGLVFCNACLDLGLQETSDSDSCDSESIAGSVAVVSAQRSEGAEGPLRTKHLVPSRGHGTSPAWTALGRKRRRNSYHTSRVRPALHRPHEYRAAAPRVGGCSGGARRTALGAAAPECRRRVVGGWAMASRSSTSRCHWQHLCPMGAIDRYEWHMFGIMCGV